MLRRAELGQRRGSRSVATIVAAGLALCLSATAARAAFLPQLYWTNYTTDAIGNAYLDGAAVDQSFVTGADFPLAVATDGHYVYWANVTSIGRTDLSGSATNQTFIPVSTDGIAVDTHYIYFTEANAIGRANIDGSGVNPNFITSLSGGPLGIAVDGNYIYWTENGAGTIGRANLDGTGVDQSFIAGANGPQGIAVDGQYVYWADAGSNNIIRCNLNSFNCVFFEPVSEPVGVAVDSQHVYYSSESTNDIYEANLDGFGATTLITGTSLPFGLAVATPYIVPTTPSAFSTTPQGTLGAPQTVTINNYGAADLTVSGLSFAGANPGDFVVTSNTCLAAIPYFGSCQITVSFAPQAQGARSATLEIYSDDFANSPTQVALSGVGGSLPQGPAGVTGPAGPEGSAGQIELVTCKTVTKTVTRHHHHKAKVKRQRCSTRLVSGTVKFTAATEHDTLSRGNVLYATGTGAQLVGAEQFVLTPVRRVAVGRYTLTRSVRHGDRWTVRRSLVEID